MNRNKRTREDAIRNNRMFFGIDENMAAKVVDGKAFYNPLSGNFMDKHCLTRGDSLTTMQNIQSWIAMAEEIKRTDEPFDSTLDGLIGLSKETADMLKQHHLKQQKRQTPAGLFKRVADSLLSRLVNEERSDSVLESSTENARKINVSEIPLTEYMKAMGQEQPVAVDGNIWVYNSNYHDGDCPSLEINVETNRWIDNDPGWGGDIYELASYWHNGYEVDDETIIADMEYYERRRNAEPQSVVNGVIVGGENKFLDDGKKLPPLDIAKYPITDFLTALGRVPVAINRNGHICYSHPSVGKAEGVWINPKTNKWSAAGGKSNILHLASYQKPRWCEDPRGFLILTMANYYKQGNGRISQEGQGVEPDVIKLDIKKLPLTEFMAALGQEQPVAVDGNIWVYNAPYSDKTERTMVINRESNQWRDTKTGAYGGIYDLAYEMIGSCNMSELNLYITGEMAGYNKRKIEQGLLEASKRRQPDEFYLLKAPEGMKEGAAKVHKVVGDEKGWYISARVNDDVSTKAVKLSYYDVSSFFSKAVTADQLAGKYLQDEFKTALGKAAAMLQENEISKSKSMKI